MKNNKGFTLIELMIVFAIIGILAVTIIPAIEQENRKNKEQSNLISTTSTIAGTIETRCINGFVTNITSGGVITQVMAENGLPQQCVIQGNEQNKAR